MSKHNFGKYVLCPYYQGEERQMIFCEGAVPESAIHLAFGTREKLREYRQSRCEKFKNDCPIAQGLNKKWGYEDGQ